jgi:hypothetical protein
VERTNLALDLFFFLGRSGSAPWVGAVGCGDGEVWELLAEHRLSMSTRERSVREPAEFISIGAIGSHMQQRPKKSRERWGYILLGLSTLPPVPLYSRRKAQGAAMRKPKQDLL